MTIKEVMPDVSKEELNRIMEILKNQNEY